MLLRSQCEIQSQKYNVGELPNVKRFADVRAKALHHIWQFTNIIFLTLHGKSCFAALGLGALGLSLLIVFSHLVILVSQYSAFIDF